jgi:23S rRNA pseudouridine1911/1915/1917 synthase
MANIEISQAKRLDQYVVEQIPNISRAFAAKLIEQGKVLVNGEQRKAGYKPRPADRITIDYDVAESEKIPDIDLPVLYEDDDCIVINKPVGVLSHSKGAFNPEATVATFLRSHVNDMGGERAGIVHRLDRATSGVMICAKNPAALGWLQKQFSQRKTKKTYMAIVVGRIEPGHAIIDMPIERNPKAPATFRVGANGKSATTEYWIEEEAARYSLVKLAPKTGRTHQLRVHMKQLGHPIVGDELYGGEPAGRLFLHALELEITLPSRERRTFTAPLPDAFAQKLEKTHA